MKFKNSISEEVFEKICMQRQISRIENSKKVDDYIKKLPYSDDVSYWANPFMVTTNYQSSKYICRDICFLFGIYYTRKYLIHRFQSFNLYRFIIELIVL